MNKDAREAARHPTHSNPKPNRNLGFTWNDAIKDVAGNDNVVIVVCKPHERELLGSPSDATWKLWQDATLVLEQRGLILRHHSGTPCWGAGASLVEVEAELPQRDKQASAYPPNHPRRSIRDRTNQLPLCVPPQIRTLQDGNGLLAAYGTDQMNTLSEHFSRLSASNESFGARSNEARVASMCLAHAASNSQVKAVGMSVYSSGQGFGPHFDKRFEEYGCNSQVSPNLDSTTP